MGDLSFKDIPSEGFNSDCGFTDRISNPTPSRKSSVVDDRISNPVPRESDFDRLSNATPTRKRNNDTDVSTVPFSSDDKRVMSDASNCFRASNPTPDRRKRGADSFQVPKSDEQASDSYSRASNPTPTRRRRSELSSPPVTFSSLGADVSDDVSRASNPTISNRRRGG
ncbi:MAG: hypothetical protein E7510_09785 [Ruminococcus sp.]|nr:hypothetical protein [Ruminococcus sp.]